MKATMEQITAGAMAYIENEVQPHLPSDGLPGFGVGFVATLAMSRAGAILRQLLDLPAVAMLDIVDKDGKVDIDSIYDAAMASMPESGLQVTLFKNTIKFHRNDIKKLRDMIAQQ